MDAKDKDTRQPGAINMDDKYEDNVLVETPYITEEEKEEIRLCSIRGVCMLKFKHEIHRRNFILTASVGIALCLLGWTFGQLGTAFPDLKQLMKTSLRQASLIFSMNSIGWFSGALVFGVIYDRTGQSLRILSCATVGVMVTTAAQPWCHTYGLFIAVRIIGGFCGGGIDAVGNAKVASCWTHQTRYYMQTLHFLYAFGGIISPLVTRPFLSRRYSIYENSTNDSNFEFTSVTVSTVNSTESIRFSTSYNIYENPTNALNDSYFESTSMTVSTPNSTGSIRFSTGLLSEIDTRTEATLTNTTAFGETKVPFAFLISAGLTLFSFSFFLTLLCCRYEETPSMAQLSEINSRKGKQSLSHPKMSKMQAAVFLFTLGVFVATYAAIECKLASFLMSFVVLHMEWTKQTGALLVSVYWATFAFGRLSAVLIARRLKPAKMIVVFLTMLIVFSFGSLAGGMLKLDVLIWVFISLSGFSCSLIFPTIIVWVNENAMRLTGKLSALFNGGGAFGCLVSPIYVGNLMDNVSLMCFVYAQIIEACLCMLLFLFLVYFLHQIRRKANV